MRSQRCERQKKNTAKGAMTAALDVLGDILGDSVLANGSLVFILAISAQATNLATSLHAHLEPEQDKLQPIPWKMIMKRTLKRLKDSFPTSLPCPYPSPSPSPFTSLDVSSLHSVVSSATLGLVVGKYGKR
ncbi:hypothetical protein EIP86_008176 [Pleurotus ostreatoroseus]|nr:hypothetical protein EIP86_008176 [Pleurotus ostreatoroseus]